MEVSFDLEDGVHPEDSLFDGIHLLCLVPAQMQARTWALWRVIT